MLCQSWDNWGQNSSQTARQAGRQTDKFFDTIYWGGGIFSFSYICYLPTCFVRRGIILNPRNFWWIQERLLNAYKLNCLFHFSLLNSVLRKEVKNHYFSKKPRQNELFHSICRKLAQSSFTLYSYFVFFKNFLWMGCDRIG